MHRDADVEGLLRDACYEVLGERITRLHSQ